MSDQLEKEFKSLFNSIGREIQGKILQAEKLMKEATELADRFGIPFTTDIVPLSTWYVPTSYQDRFQAVDKELVRELTDVDSYRLGRAYGWQYSQIC